MTPHDMTPSEERLMELLADRATQGLTPEEETELEQLLAEHPEIDVDMLEEAAAAVDLFLTGEPSEPLPKHLSDQLKRQAPNASENAKSPTPVEPVKPVPESAPVKSGRYWPILAVCGWLAAAVFLVFLVRNPTPDKPTPTELADKWLRDGDCQEIKGKSADAKKYPKANGKVLWKTSKQKGFLMLNGIPSNNPKESRYQLWIIDGKRSPDSPPINGGLFDVKDDGQVVIPFEPQLPVAQVVAFAITREQPEGVVVSNKEDIVFLASVN